MRAASASLVSFLSSRQPCYIADLFTLTLADGSKYYWTSADGDLTYNGTTWTSQGLCLKRGKWGLKNTIEIPELSVTLMALDTDFVGGVSVKKLIHQGGFDGARMLMSRVWMPTFGDTSLGVVDLFNGRMSSIKLTGGGADLTIKGDNLLLDQQMPRNIWQASCLHTLFDSGCKLIRDNFAILDSVGSGSTPTVRTMQWSTPPTNYVDYSQGKVVFTSGTCKGVVRTIASTDASSFTLVYPLPALPAAGDAFTMYPGCNRTLTRCKQLNNEANFRAFPYVPAAELAY